MILNKTALFLYKNEGNDVNIDFIDVGKNDTISITSDDIPKFKKTSFGIPVDGNVT